MLLAAAVVVVGRMRERGAKRQLPVLYCFQRGLILHEPDPVGRLRVHPWSDVDVEIRRRGHPLEAMYGPSAPELLLSTKGGEFLASVTDAGKMATLKGLLP